MNKLHIIIGSTREGRAAAPVARWVERRAIEHGGFDVTLLDLREWRLPMFAETLATIGDFNDPTYSEPIVRQWNRTIVDGDAFIFITPEYNHSFSGVLKNAIDSVFASWGLRNKPAAFVGYSAGLVGGARAVEQLALVTIEAEMVPLRNSVLVGAVHSAFDVDGQPTNLQSDMALAILLEDLSWWTDTTVAARSAGELEPGSLRFRALAAIAAG
ncbi:MAG TPA: NAD(P)H-dependent oxidoreductase [Dehalococcoidia bacterium]|nr:NAD(P)H-dependent oxidoreductase [Dehalococcoidia bacterium]